MTDTRWTKYEKIMKREKYNFWMSAETEHLGMGKEMEEL